MFALLISAIVPFIGHIENGALFCNAPCVVRDSAANILFVSDQPISAPWNGPQSEVTVSPL